MKKRMFAMLLVLTMLMTMFPASAFAQEASPEISIADFGFAWEYADAVARGNVSDAGDQTLWVALSAMVNVEDGYTIEFLNNGNPVFGTNGGVAIKSTAAASFLNSTHHNETDAVVKEGDVLSAKLYKGGEVIDTAEYTVPASTLAISDVSYNGDKTVTITMNKKIKGDYWVNLKQGENTILGFSLDGNTANDKIVATLGKALVPGEYTVELALSAYHASSNAVAAIANSVIASETFTVEAPEVHEHEYEVTYA